MDANEFRRRGHETVERIARYYETIGENRVLSNVEPGYLAKLLPTEAPEDPESFDLIAADFESKIMQGVTHWQHPNFYAFFPTGSSFPSILGDMYSSMIACVGFNWQTSPSCTELETIVMDWMGKAIGLDESFLSHGDGGGVIQGTASEAVAVAVIAARQRVLDRLRERQGLNDEQIREIQPKLIAYGSSATHSCTEKASTIANVRFRKIVTDPDHRLRGEAVRAAIKEDIAKGLIPFYITATIGSTSTGIVDAIPEIVEAVKGTDIWIHIDAAWAGSALVCEEFAHCKEGVEHADSFDFNMHKWMLTNFDCSPMWVKKRKYLTNALSITPVFLRNPQTDSGLVTDYRDWQLPLGRRFRSLKVWFVIRSYGLKGIRENIRKHVAQAHAMVAHLATEPTLFKLTTGPNFALITFQVLPPAEAPSSFPDTNALTKEVYNRINEDGNIFLTHTNVDGKDLIRFVSGSPWTTDVHIDNAFEVIKRIAKSVIAESEPPAYYGRLYRDNNLHGAHVIKLGDGNDDAAKEALAAWPGGLQVGGGINIDNAQEWINLGAAKVIVTSWLFPNAVFSEDRLRQLSEKIGKDRLVVDVSCKVRDSRWVVAMNKWQTLTDMEVTKETISLLEQYCSEFLVHAADVEGLCKGIDERLVMALGEWCSIPVTYAGGGSQIRDLALVDRLSNGKVDLTFGSALDIFGGTGVKFQDCVDWNNQARI
ncbi:hypothetical protein HDU97_000865 [Phlyctochytrium planicorne]|nr:hypothetical protein HDU97_000865 [Phlyctochytrium planicorne]